MSSIDTLDKEQGKGTYWYFRFSERFFDDLEILRLQNLPGNAGYEYIVILLKLYCLSTRNGGYIKIRTAFTGGIDFKLIADSIHHDNMITLKAAMQYFFEVGLIQIMESVDYTTFLAPGVKNNIGKSSKGADKKREIRSKSKANEEIPKATEKLLEFEGESQNLIKEERRNNYGILQNISLTSEEVKSLCERYENADAIINKASSLKTSAGGDVDGKSDSEIVEQLAKKTGIRKSTNQESDVPKGIFNNVKISKAEWEKLCKEFGDPRGLVDYISQRIYAGNYKMSSDYAFAVKVGREDGWQTLGEKLKEEQVKEDERAAQIKKKEEQIYQRYLREAKIGCDPPKEVIELLGNDIYDELREISADARQKELLEREEQKMF